MPYFTLGYPNYATSLDIIEACCNAGADLMELGIPFSDPLADGPTIQHSTQVALDNGITVKKCLEGVRELRARGIKTPFMLMGYFNPALAYGIENYVAKAAAAGANGFIVPDLPPDEAEGFKKLAEENGLALTFLASPNSTEERLDLVTEQSTGFVYLVSVIGITGAREALPSDLEAFISRVRKRTSKPLAVGFGISSPEQAKGVGKAADGVIVGSALIKTVREALEADENPQEAAAAFVSSLRAAL